MVSDQNMTNKIYHYLRDEYQGVLTENQLHQHFNRYVEYEEAEELIQGIRPLLKPNMKVLDLGCGYGSFVLRIHPYVSEIVGVEVSDFELKVANKRLTKLDKNSIKRIKFIKQNGNEIPLDTQIFDMVTTWNVLEHVQNPQGLISEIARVLKPGGIWMSICPNYARPQIEPHYKKFIPLFSKRLGRVALIIQGKNVDFWDNHVFPISASRIRKLARENSFSLIHSQIKFAKIQNPKLIKNLRIRSIIAFLIFLRLEGLLKVLILMLNANPFSRTVIIQAQKNTSTDKILKANNRISSKNQRTSTSGV